MIELRYGAFRNVILVGPLAIKLPRPTSFMFGLRCNRWEREMWRVWRPKFGWENLCPVKLADPWGLVVVMARASPVTFEEVVAADRDYYPDICVEYKPENWGLVGSNIVAVDYGIPDAETVIHQRKYLETRPSRKTA